MAASPICLDQDQNAVDCSDPNCTYGDCGASGASNLGAGAGGSSLCLDQNQNSVSCSDPNCTYGDCVSAGSLGGVAQSESGGTSITTQTSTAIGSILAGINAIINPPVTARTGINPSTGLPYSTATGSAFSNPLLIGFLLLVAWFVFGKK